MEPEPEPQLDVSVETQLSADGWASASRTEAGALKDWEHQLPVEVFISDTDSYAIIYHTQAPFAIRPAACDAQRFPDRLLVLTGSITSTLSAPALSSSA